MKRCFNLITENKTMRHTRIGPHLLVYYLICKQQCVNVAVSLGCGVML